MQKSPAPPEIIYYDRDFIDLYDRTWSFINDAIHQPKAGNKFSHRYFNHPENKTINQFEAIMSTFYLLYSTCRRVCETQLDNFYVRQEENGAIWREYWVETGEAVSPTTRKTQQARSVGPPLFAWAEYNIYHKHGDKKRLVEVLPHLEKYWKWIDSSFKDEETGLYRVSAECSGMGQGSRDDAAYPIDFNLQQAISALYIAEIGQILNEKYINFRYNQIYFYLKIRINKHMWDETDGFYYDLDKGKRKIKIKTVAAFWALLAKVPNENKLDCLLAHLKNPKTFGGENPFPTLAIDEKKFSEEGQGYNGSVVTPYTFIIIKGLENYMYYSLAREYALRHIYTILDTLSLDTEQGGHFWEAYKPLGEGAAQKNVKTGFPRQDFVTFTALATVTMMIENIIGIHVNLPRKTVDLIVPTIEQIGIKNLNLRKNNISILIANNNRGWEIHLESEKLYYFTINLVNQNKTKTLPLPSCKCSMMLDKV